MTCSCCSCSSSTLAQIVVLVAVGAGVGALHASRQPLVDQPPPATETTAAAASPSAGAPSAPLGLYISLADAKRLYDEGVPFIDARPDHEYVHGTILNAFHIPPARFTSDESTQALRVLDQSKPVVVFCTGGECDDSRNLAGLLKAYGFTDLHIMNDGYPAWEKAGYDTIVPPAAGG